MKFPWLILLAGVAGLPWLAGCASAAATVTVAAVGPGTDSRPVSGADGYLKVFTATHRVDVDFQAYFNPHSGYRVEDASGRTVRFVPNHSSDEDEAPDVVGLSPGTYNVIAQSTWYGLVKVPVRIEPGRTTVVQLDGHWRGGAHNAALVRLPNGETVGWSAAAPNP